MNKNNPLVSVLIPAYNHEKYIQETIFSIINQTYKNIELLVIDDGSNDSTFDKICELEIVCKKRFIHFEFEKQKNAGVITTMNLLLDKAKGDYVFINASDDVAAPHAIETELSFLANNPGFVLCVGNNDIIDGYGHRCFWDKSWNNVYSVSDAHFLSFSDSLTQTYPSIDFSTDGFGSYYNLVYYGNHIPNGYLIKKAVFEKTGYYAKEAPLEDYWMMMQIAKHGKMKYINDTLFYYRWHGDNVTFRIQGLYLTYKTLLHELVSMFPGVQEFKDHSTEPENRSIDYAGKIKILGELFHNYYQKGKYR